jgi:hypothetical protein
VSTAISGVPEIVDSGVDGVLVQPDDPYALTRELTELLASHEKRQEVANRGRNKALEKFDQKKNVGRLLDLFQGVESVSSRPAGAGEAPHGHSHRILYVSTDKGIAFGGTKGASIHIREFVDALDAEGFAPTVAVRKRDAVDRRLRKYPVYVLPSGGSAAFPGAPALAEAREYALNAGF